MACHSFKIIRYMLPAVLLAGLGLFYNLTSAKAAARGLANAGYAVVIAPDGSIYVGGTFSKAGGKPVANIAKWDGTNWSALGAGCDPNGVIAMAVDARGILYAGGWISEAGGKHVDAVAKWDGAKWSPMGTEMGRLDELAVAPDGTVYAMGEHKKAGYGVAAFKDGKWSVLGQGFQASTMAVSPDGTLYAAGDMAPAGKKTAFRVVKWDGARWQPLGGVGMIVSSMTVAPDGSLYVGGEHQAKKSNMFKKWNGSAWETLVAPVNGVLVRLQFSKDGTLYGITSGGDSPMSTVFAIQKWNGKTWNTMTKPSDDSYESLAIAPDNTLYVAGYLNVVGTEKNCYTAKWDGSKWSPMGAGVTE